MCFGQGLGLPDLPIVVGGGGDGLVPGNLGGDGLVRATRAGWTPARQRVRAPARGGRRWCSNKSGTMVNILSCEQGMGNMVIFRKI
jgi:hypothetical protein